MLFIIKKHFFVRFQKLNFFLINECHEDILFSAKISS